MEVPTINTIDDLLVSETLRGGLYFTTLLAKLPLPTSTSISDAIKFCIDNDKLEFAELIKLLSDKKFGVNDISPCEYALRSKHFSMIPEMMKCGFDIDSIGFARFIGADCRPVPAIVTAILCSSSHQDTEALKFILSLKPNLDIKFGHEETPLMYLIRLGKYGRAGLLLDANANVMIKNNKGEVAANYCELYPNLPKSQILKEKILSKYKLDNVEDLITRETHRGAYGQVELIKILCPDSESIDNIILKSVTGYYLDLVKCIVTDFNMIPENNKFTILKQCVCGQRLDMLEFFLTKGANIDICTRENVSLLMVAASYGVIDIVKFLIDKKANLDIMTAKGNTAITIALYRNHYNIADILLDANASFINKNNPKRNALYVCKRKPCPIHKKNEWQHLLDRLEKMTIALQKSQDSIDEPRETVETPQKTVKKPEEIVGKPQEQIDESQEPIVKSHDVCVDASDDALQETIEKPQKSDDPICVCVNSKGNEYAIPEKLIILACWDKQLNLDLSKIKSHFHQIQGLIKYDTPLDGKWHTREYTFPICSIEIPENYVPSCHVIPSGISGFNEGVIIRFFQCQYA